jgi:hypothetical protein
VAHQVCDLAAGLDGEVCSAVPALDLRHGDAAHDCNTVGALATESNRLSVEKVQRIERLVILLSPRSPRLRVIHRRSRLCFAPSSWKREPMRPQRKWRHLLDRAVY